MANSMKNLLGPITTLTNGKIVGNFSSPHPFTFTDGSILTECSPELAKHLQVDFIEVIEDEAIGDIELSFKLNDTVIYAMAQWNKLHRNGDVHVVFCPLPMITAIKAKFGLTYLKHSPFRSIRIDDRVQKLVSITKQCI